MFCENCGKKLNKGDKFCEKCGVETKTNGTNKTHKKSIIKKWWFWLLTILILLIVGGGIFGLMKYQENKVRKFNREFESQYQHITSFRFGLGEDDFNLYNCKPLETIDLESKINDFNLYSNKNEVNTTIDRFVDCVGDEMVQSHTKESQAISDLSGKINGLQTKEQKALAEDLVKTLRDIVNNEEDEDNARRKYYDKQREWAWAIKSYINGEISLSQRNQAVDELNKTFDNMGTEVRNTMPKATGLEGKRDDIFSRLINLMQR